MFLTLLVASASCRSASESLQIWEKPIANGLVYREEIDRDGPHMFHILRFRPGKEVRATCELAGGTVYEKNVSKGRATVSEMVKSSHALAGINGDYFPFTGDPLGLMIHSGYLVSLPYVVPATHATRSAMLWGPKGATFSNAFTFTGSVTLASGDPVKLDGWDQECSENTVTLSGPAAGLAMAKVPNIHLILTLDHPGTLSASTTATVKEIRSNEPFVDIPSDSVVLTAQGTKAALFTQLKFGDKVTVNWSLQGIPKGIEEAIGGGPTLVEDGKVAVDASAEGFNAAFSENHHPRTAIGRRADGEVWFVVVDGRQKMSDGMPLIDLAKWFVSHGCTDAMNLDGGGSSAMNLTGVLVNRPSDGAERPVANGVLFSTTGTADRQIGDSGIEIKVPTSIALADSPNLTLRTQDGKAIPNKEVIWACQGAAWIDQGGTLHPMSDGSAIVTASYRGSIVSQAISLGHTG